MYNWVDQTDLRLDYWHGRCSLLAGYQNYLENMFLGFVQNRPVNWCLSFLVTNFEGNIPLPDSELSYCC